MAVIEEKDILISKLDQLEARFCEIEKQISDPTVSSSTGPAFSKISLLRRLRPSELKASA